MRPLLSPRGGLPRLGLRRAFTPFGLPSSLWLLALLGGLASSSSSLGRSLPSLRSLSLLWRLLL